jgi:hypothetical protein
LTVCGLILHEQGEVVLVELLEPLIPTDPFKRSFSAVAGKVEPDDAGLVATFCSANRCRSCTAFLRPSADLFMICEDS